MPFQGSNSNIPSWGTPIIPAVTAPTIPPIKGTSVGASSYQSSGSDPNSQGVPPPPKEGSNPLQEAWQNDPVRSWLSNAFNVLKESAAFFSNYAGWAFGEGRPGASWNNSPAGPSGAGWRTAWETLLKSPPPAWLGGGP